MTGSAAPRALELCVEYHCTVDNIAFGRIPREVLAKLLSSGRLAGILLEHEIAAIMGSANGTQGASPDLIDPRIGRIQCKTFHGQPDPMTVLRSGPNAGKRKIDIATIWTTKSGYWDRYNRMTPADHADAEAYFTHYDAFMYLDIGQFEQGRYSFVTIPSADVIRLKQQYLISEASIKSVVRRVEVIG